MPKLPTGWTRDHPLDSGAATAYLNPNNQGRTTTIANPRKSRSRVVSIGLLRPPKLLGLLSPHTSPINGAHETEPAILRRRVSATFGHDPNRPLATLTESLLRHRYGKAGIQTTFQKNVPRSSQCGNQTTLTVSKNNVLDSPLPRITARTFNWLNIPQPGLRGLYLSGVRRWGPYSAAPV